MKIVVAHNRYRSHVPSGENLVVDEEVKRLQDLGIGVATIFRDSDSIGESLIGKFMVAWQLSGSDSRRAEFRRHLRDLNGRVLHVHNIFPLFGTDLWIAAKELGMSVVQTVHNHRLFATDQRVVKAGRLMAPRTPDEIIHTQRLSPLHDGWLRNRMYARALRSIWGDQQPQTAVDRWIVHSGFHHELLVEAGIDSDRIVVRMHARETVPTPTDENLSDHALFVGRLKAEKGLEVLAQHWPANRPLRIIGSGPDAALASRIAGDGFLGPRTRAEVQDVMAQSRFIVVTSQVYEGGGLPLVVIEALALGTPVVAPAIGAFPELIAGRGVGWCYDPSKPTTLRSVVESAWEAAPGIREHCRAVCRRDHDPHAAMDRLVDVYRALGA